MFGRRKYKRLLVMWLGALSSLVIMLAAFNYYIDPLWCFRHVNRFNRMQAEFDDRQQKTNYLKFGGESYDTLIIGNSRVRTMNQNDFGPHAFNYALSGMIPQEYEGYIDFAKKINGRSFDRLVLGLSFIVVSRDMELYSGRKPEYYFESVEQPQYRYCQLLSGDVFKHSVLNLNHAVHKDLITYFDRNNVQHVRKERVQFDKSMASDLAGTRLCYHDNFHYSEQYRPILESIKKHNASSNITVFTTPVTQPLFCSMVLEGRLNDYKRWLRDIVEVFGEVHHFEYLNSITKDYRRYYFDGQHQYPETGTLMVHRIAGVDDPALPADFGMVVNRANIEEKIQEIEAASSICR